MTGQRPLPSIEQLAQRVERLHRARVVCVGDVMLDRVVEGQVSRISPEAPIPVLDVRRERAVAGGAANVAANLDALGATVSLIAVTGADAAGDELRDVLAVLAGAHCALIRDAARPTTVKTRFLAQGQQLLRADREERAPLQPAIARAVIDQTTEALATADALVLSDYAKGTLTDAVIAALIAAARAAGKPVIVDPKGTDFARYRGATLLTPNRVELQAASGLPVGDEALVTVAAERLRASSGVEMLLATLGADGMLLADAGGHRRLAAVPREVFDVVGAGDTVIAILAAVLATGADALEAAMLANLGGSIAVGRHGTATVSDSDLLAALGEARGTGHQAKIMDAASACRLAAQAKLRGRRVGFTNGCFDILHPGHVGLVGQARARCDLLVLGLNSDASVRRLKGPTRPVNDERTRALVLAALAGVDAVVIFAEDTPLELIRALRPDLLVKGADYTVAEVVGGADVLGWGGEVYLADLTPDASTTATIARMNAKPAKPNAKPATTSAKPARE